MLDLSEYLTEVKMLNPRLGVALENIQDAINQLGTVGGVDPTQHIQPPTAPQSMNVKAANGMAHITITDESDRSRGLHYFVEGATDSAFSKPHIFHLGVGRGLFVPLPALDDNGVAQNWYFRSYSMYPGSSQRSEHQVFGGKLTPTPVSVGGTAQLTPLPSTGAGTAPSNGQQRQSDGGFGVNQFSRLSPGRPKAP